MSLTRDEAAAAIRSREGYTVDERTGCWIWPDRSPTGLGPFLAFWLAVYDDPPVGFRVVHRCPGAAWGCVRPSHLDLVPQDQTVVETWPAPPIHEHARAQFASDLRAEREARRWTLAQMGKELSVSQERVRSWESGTAWPDENSYRELSTRFGWDGKLRKWLVTVVHQRVVVERSAGRAAALVRRELEAEGQPDKTELVEVRRV